MTMNECICEGDPLDTRNPDCQACNPTVPKMNLKVWDLPLDPYDSKALADNLKNIDPHDMSPGRGIQLPRKRERDALRLLRGFVEHEDQPCQFDHHGCCQEHGWFGEPGECGVREARQLLGLDPV